MVPSPNAAQAITLRRTRAAAGLEDSPARPHKKARPQSPSRSVIDELQDTHAAVLGELKKKYHPEILRITSSTHMRSKIEAVLRHLGQFHPRDMTVLPGVILLYSSSKSMSKMFGIVEIVKRRIHEIDQKWYQYNLMHQTPVKADMENISRIEETILAQADNPASDDEDDAFEPLPPPHRDAIMPPNNPRPRLSLSVFLSRVPIAELVEKGYTQQSNETRLEQERKVRMQVPVPRTWI